MPYSPTRCMLARTPTESIIENSTSMTKESCASGLVFCPWPSGRCFCTNIHLGYIDWATFQSNQTRIDSNVHPEPHQAGGAVREGAALLQGLATCGKCGRRLHTHYTGRNAAPGYHCAGKDIVSGRGVYCLNVGGVEVDRSGVPA